MTEQGNGGWACYPQLMSYLPQVMSSRPLDSRAQLDRACHDNGGQRLIQLPKESFCNRQRDGVVALAETGHEAECDPLRFLWQHR